MVEASPRLGTTSFRTILPPELHRMQGENIIEGYYTNKSPSPKAIRSNFSDGGVVMRGEIEAHS